jgi:hypothetical protein
LGPEEGRPGRPTFLCEKDVDARASVALRSYAPGSMCAVPDLSLCLGVHKHKAPLARGWGIFLPAERSFSIMRGVETYVQLTMLIERLWSYSLAFQ